MSNGFPPANRLLTEGDLDRTLDLLPRSDWLQLNHRRLFLTGGTGFVGKWLLGTLLHAVHRFDLTCEVSVLSRDPAAFARTSPELAGSRQVTLLKGDVRTFPFPAGSFDTVVHAATDVVAKSTPETTFDTCVQGTRQVLDFAARCGAKDLLLVSSGAVYGRQPPELLNVPESHSGAPDPLRAASAYGEGKRASEWLAAAWAERTGLQLKIARCFAFVGPHLPLDKQFAIGNFMRSALANEDIVIEGDGTPYRSYLYAADMAAWLWAVLFRGESGVAYNVGAEESVSIAELAQRVAAMASSNCRIETRLRPVEGRPAERYVPDTARARHDLHLPEPLTLDESIARTLEWHRHSDKHQEAST